MNANYKVSSKKRYIKRTNERKNKQNNLSSSNFDVLKSNNDFEIFISKKSDELKKYKEIYSKHMWCSCDEYICNFCSFDNKIDCFSFLNYGFNYECNTQNNDEYIYTIITNNIITKFKKAINDYIKNTLNIIIENKLKNINFINKINNEIIISKPIYENDNKYNCDSICNEFFPCGKIIKKSIIFYDEEHIIKYLLNNIINYKLKTYHDVIFKSISLKNDISIYRKNKINNYARFQYLLCMISIIKQKCNFQDYGFCNYFISFL